jgi:hypothetical protein
MDTLRAAGMQQTGGPASIQAEEHDSDYHVEQKELCLVEKERTACPSDGYNGPTSNLWT